MSPATAETMLIYKAGPRSYSGDLAFAATQTALLKLTRQDLFVGKRPRLATSDYKRQPRRVHHEISSVGGGARQHTEASYIAGTHLAELVSDSFDTTGLVSQQVFDLIRELASRPQSYTAFISRVRKDEPTQANDGTDAELQQSKRMQVINALAQQEIGDIDASSPFPLNAFSSLSPEEGAELERILNAGPPPWVREIIERKAQRG